jgi:four helix bundle protein
MGEYRQLRVWQQAHGVALATYRITSAFPASEQYGLTSQMRRAAVSIPANIAEGTGRNTQNELARFCRIALGSAAELDYHVLPAGELGLLLPGDHEELSAEIRRLRKMLSRFLRAIAARPDN